MKPIYLTGAVMALLTLNVYAGAPSLIPEPREKLGWNQAIEALKGSGNSARQYDAVVSVVRASDKNEKEKVAALLPFLSDKKKMLELLESGKLGDALSVCAKELKVGSEIFLGLKDLELYSEKDNWRCWINMIAATKYLKAVSPKLLSYLESTLVSQLEKDKAFVVLLGVVAKHSKEENLKPILEAARKLKLRTQVKYVCKNWAKYRYRPSLFEYIVDVCISYSKGPDKSEFKTVSWALLVEQKNIPQSTPIYLGNYSKVKPDHAKRFVVAIDKVLSEKQKLATADGYKKLFTTQVTKLEELRGAMVKKHAQSDGSKK